MALTKVSGGILDPGINVAGIVTATGFDGPFTGGSSKNITAGIITATELDLNGNGNISGNLVVEGNLTANGDFTTLNTTLREVELLRVDAQNDNVAAGIITQRGTGNILDLYDTSSAVFSVRDGGNIIMGASAGSITPHAPLHIRTATTGAITTLLKLHGPFTSNTGSEGTAIDFGTASDTSTGARIIGSREAAGAKGALRFCTGRENDAGFNDGRMVIDETGTVGIGSATPLSAMALDVVGSIRYSNQLRGAGGSASTPSYAFYGDHDTGMYRGAGINILSFATAGTERFKLDADGVATFLGATGIHTGVKVEQTALNYNAGLEINATNGGQSRLLLKTSKSGTNRAARIDFYNQDAQKWTLINDFDQNGTNDLSIRYGIDGGSWGEYLTMNPGAQVELFHGGTKKFETQADGCHIYGSYGLQIYGGLAGTNANAQLNLYPTGTAVYSYFKGYKSDSSRSAGLTVYDGSNVYLDSTGTGSGGAVYLRAYGTGFLQFETANTPRVKIHDDGEVEIKAAANGQTVLSCTAAYASSSTVDIQTWARSDSAVKAAMKYNHGTNSMNFGTTTNHPLIFQVNNTERVRIDSDGNILLKDAAGQGNSLVHYIRVNDSGGNSQYQLGMVSSGNQDLYLIQSKDANLRFQTNATTRWKIDGDGHLLPETAGAVNIGSASAEIGDVYIADDKKIFLGDSQDVEIYHSDHLASSFIKKSGTGNFYFDFDGDFTLRNAAGSQRANFVGPRAQVELYHTAQLRLSTTTTGITVGGEVAASQDYPDFRPALDLNFVQNQTLDPRITYSRVGTASFTDENGRLRWVGSHVPRFDHEPGTGKPRGLLVEAAGTNLMKANSYYYSTNVPSTTYFSNTNGAVGELSTDILAPDGSRVTMKVHWPNGYSATQNGYVRIGNGSVIGQLTAGDYAFSYFVKRGTDGAHNMDDILTNNGVGGLSFTAQDFSPYYAPTVNIRTDTNADLIVEKYPDGWYRISNVLFNANQTWNPDNTGVSHYVLSGNNYKVHYEAMSYYYWGMQLEKNPVSTSYIGMTVQEQTTRAADSAVIEGENFDEFFNHNGAENNDYQGTLIASVESAAASSPSAGRYNKIQLEQNNDNKVQLCVVGGGSPYYDSHITYGTGTQADFTGSQGSTFPTVIKHGVAFAKNNAAYSYNGNTVETDTSVNVGGVSTATHGKYTQLTIGLSPTKAHIKRVMYYSQRISNTQLRNLTS